MIDFDGYKLSSDFLIVDHSWLIYHNAYWLKLTTARHSLRPIMSSGVSARSAEALERKRGLAHSVAAYVHAPYYGGLLKARLASTAGSERSKLSRRSKAGPLADIRRPAT